MTNLRPSHLLVLIGLLLGGCVTDFQRPTVAVRGMSMQEVTPEGFTMNFEVDMENPNDFALPMVSVDYMLRVVERDLLDGKANPELSILANGSSTLTLPVHVTFENLLSISDGIRRSGGDVPYELEAGFEFGGGGMPLLSKRVRVPVTFSGTLPMRQLLKDPAVLLRSQAARKLAQEVLGGLLGR